MSTLALDPRLDYTGVAAVEFNYTRVYYGIGLNLVVVLLPLACEYY